MIPSKLHFHPTENELIQAEKNQAKAWKTQAIGLTPG
jgi:hypothetical protein